MAARAGAGRAAFLRLLSPRRVAPFFLFLPDSWVALGRRKAFVPGQITFFWGEGRGLRGLFSWCFGAWNVQPRSALALQLLPTSPLPVISEARRILSLVVTRMERRGTWGEGGDGIDTDGGEWRRNVVRLRQQREKRLTRVMAKRVRSTFSTECHHHHHLSLKHEGRWGTTDDFATSFAWTV